MCTTPSGRSRQMAQSGCLARRRAAAAGNRRHVLQTVRVRPARGARRRCTVDVSRQGRAADEVQAGVGLWVHSLPHSSNWTGAGNGSRAADSGSGTWHPPHVRIKEARQCSDMCVRWLRQWATSAGPPAQLADQTLVGVHVDARHLGAADVEWHHIGGLVVPAPQAHAGAVVVMVDSRSHSPRCNSLAPCHQTGGRENESPVSEPALARS